MEKVANQDRSVYPMKIIQKTGKIYSLKEKNPKKKISPSNPTQSNLNIMKFEVNDEFADAFVAMSLKDSLEMVADQINELKKKKVLQDHNKEDLADCITNYEALEKVYYYYTGKQFKL
jgi:hypothetical protein